MPILFNIVISALASAVIFVGGMNIPASTFSLSQNHLLGAFTEISTATNLADFPTTYNLNLTKTIEVGTTSVPSITTLAGLTTASALSAVGTLTSGSLGSGFTAVVVARGGTGSTTLSSNQLLLGNGTGNIGVVSGWGTSGQFLTSNGTTLAPTWQTGAIDQAGTYTWTGGHMWTASTTHSATTTIVANSVTNNALVLNGVAYQFPTANGLGVLRNDNTGTLSWSTPVRYTIASTTLNSLTSTGVQTTYATSTLIILPANTLSASSTISVKGHNTSIATGNADTVCTASIKVGNTFIGTVTLPTRDVADGTDINIWEIDIYSNNSVSSQTYFSTFNSNNGTPGTVVGGSDGSSSIDFSSAQTLLFVISTKSQSGGTSSECTHESLFMEINP